jgi:hypothetical protein
MKKSKLSIEKFKIAELKNSYSIIGGTGVETDGDLTTGTGTRTKTVSTVFDPTQTK